MAVTRAALAQGAMTLQSFLYGLSSFFKRAAHRSVRAAINQFESASQLASRRSDQQAWSWGGAEQLMTSNCARRRPQFDLLRF